MASERTKSGLRGSRSAGRFLLLAQSGASPGQSRAQGGGPSLYTQGGTNAAIRSFKPHGEVLFNSALLRTPSGAPGRPWAGRGLSMKASVYEGNAISAHPGDCNSEASSSASRPPRMRTRSRTRTPPTGSGPYARRPQPAAVPCTPGTSRDGAGLQCLSERPSSWAPVAPVSFHFLRTETGETHGNTSGALGLTSAEGGGRRAAPSPLSLPNAPRPPPLPVLSARLSPLSSSFLASLGALDPSSHPRLSGPVWLWRPQAEGWLVARNHEP